jgi:hypothetical protein
MDVQPALHFEFFDHPQAFFSSGPFLATSSSHSPFIIIIIIIIIQEDHHHSRRIWVILFIAARMIIT